MTTENPERLIDKTAAPTPEQIEKHVGKRNYSLWRERFLKGGEIDVRHLCKYVFSDQKVDSIAR